MCGFAGVVTAVRDPDVEDLADLAQEMASVLVHRGPDDRGVWVGPGGRVAFGFRRLAIVDLSAAGHQPMTSRSGRYTLAFNGELYNHREIRRQLQGRDVVFAGTSDTEVFLAAVEQWGPIRALHRANGMFALALWDAKDRSVLLARDRLGEKPLYYGHAGTDIVFGSELKALAKHPRFDTTVDRRALSSYFRYGFVPAPLTIYRGVRKLLPGSWVVLRADGRRPLPEPHPYWSFEQVTLNAMDDPFRGSMDEAAEQLDHLLHDSVGMRMVADVPVGAFLSGGIDSSTVVSIMQAEATAPVRTFTIGFHERTFDEAASARSVATHLGTDHTELYVSPEAAQGVIPVLPAVYDEPFADPSQIPTLLVSKLAREQVKVVLSGDGGDELFGGYDRYQVFARLERILDRTPAGIRLAAARAIGAMRPRQWDALWGVARPVLPRWVRNVQAGSKAFRLRSLLMAPDDDRYRVLMSHWAAPDRLVLGAGAAADDPGAMSPAGAITVPVARAMAADTVCYLPDDILVKVDRASMAVGLEARLPLLDHRIVEWAWRLPMEYKVDGGIGKRVLRAVLRRYVPDRLVDRPKMGFGVPIGSWLRGPLRPWAEDLLDAARLRTEGYLDPDAVRRVWRDHVSERHDWQYVLWDILMFEAWLDTRNTTGAGGSH